MAETAHHEHLEAQFCEKHPNVETNLRCNRCGRLMCSRCAVRTPTGYRCDDCVKGQQKIFDTATPPDFIFGSLTAGFLGFIGGLVIPNLWFILVFIGGPLAGVVIAEAVRRVVSRRRSKRLFQAVTAAAALGGLLPALGSTGILLLLTGMGNLGQVLGTLGFSLVWQLVYVVLCASSAYYRLSGIRL